MISPTSVFKFEYQLADWSSSYSCAMFGRANGFFVGFRPDGSPRRVYFAPAASAMAGDRKNALAAAYSHWFMFNPHDDGTAYLEWLGLPRAWVLPWLGASDPLELGHVAGGDSLDLWPVAWRVIVASR